MLDAPERGEDQVENAARGTTFNVSDEADATGISLSRPVVDFVKRPRLFASPLFASRRGGERTPTSV
jgi:hypothetical protein